MENTLMSEEEILASFEEFEATNDRYSVGGYAYCETCGENTRRRADGSCVHCE